MKKKTLIASIATAAVVVLGSAGPARADGAEAIERPIVFTDVAHFEKSQYFPPNPGIPEPCGGPGVTEISKGTEHLHVTELANSFHVVYGETFRITMVFDDGRPDLYRQGTDAWTFQLAKDGDVQVFHESFHDFGPPWGKIQFFTTFVVMDGEVHVDHYFDRNSPTC